MAKYIVNKTDGTAIEVDDGTLDISTDLVLLGKNYTGYGEFVAENFVRLMENFSNNTAPTKPITGQLWYCKDNTSAASGLNVYDGTRFIPLPRYFKAETAPQSPTTLIDGDLWWNRTSKQLFGYNGSGWVLIGPSSTVTQGKTGLYAEDIYDTTGNLHTVLSLYVKNNRIYINSQDSAFTPVDVVGFSTIKPGINANVLVQSGSIRFAGIATGAENATTVGVSALTESQLMRKDINQTTVGTITIDNANGLTIKNILQVSAANQKITLQNINSSNKFTIRNYLDVDAIVVEPSNSYIGIFKSNPVRALDINGDAGVSGTLTAAGTLIANATGVYSDNGKNWTQSSLTDLGQLSNGPGYITDLDYLNVTNGLGYVPVRQLGDFTVKLAWNDMDLEAYRGEVNKGALAFKADIANRFLGRIVDVWQTSSDGQKRLYFNSSGSTGFGSGTGQYYWKKIGGTDNAALLDNNGNLTLGNGTAWTTSTGPNPLTNLNQLTNGPGYLTNADKVEIATLYLGRTADQWQTSSDGINRLLFAGNAETIFGSNSTYVWTNPSSVTIAKMSSNGNLALGTVPGGNVWTTSGGPNPLTDLDQLNNGPGYITSADVPSLGYTPVRQEGSTVLKLGWSSSGVKAYNGSTDTGALAYKANIPTNLNQLTNGPGYITSADVPTKTSELDNDSGFLTSVTVTVPTKTSDLENDSGFITNATSDGRYIGKTVGVQQTSSDGVNRFLFASGGGTTFGSSSGYTFNSGGSFAASISAAGKFTAADDVVAFSDAKLKTNVHTIENALNTVRQLRGVTFTRLDDNRDSLGVIAQEVQKVLPELVSETDGTLGVAYGNMVGVLIEAIKEQQTQINDLQNQINSLRDK